MRDEAQEDYDREYRYAQNEHNKNSRAPADTAERRARYYRFYDQDDDTMCDVVWVDRTTGQRVMRYDAADPANTNPYYGATSDGDCFKKKGLDIKEMVPASEVKFTDAELRQRHSEAGRGW